MNDMIRRPQEQFSPKSSPRGARSPVVVPRQDSSGTLKATISLGGKTPAITLVQHGPFYLTKDIPTSESELTGATNLMSYHNLEHAYNKFCLGRKMKEQLSAFLPNLPGNIDITPGSADNSSLRLLIERPPIGGKELLPLTPQQLTGFRLHPGPPLPEKYRLMNTPVRSKKHKHKKSKQKGPGDTPSHEGNQADSSLDATAAGGGIGSARDDKKHKKQRRHDEDKERKKKKKEKKKKKAKHSPESAGLSNLMPPHGV